MDRQRRTGWTEVRALICRSQRDYLIVKPHADPECPWGFPGGRVAPTSAAEEAVRRLCLEQVGVAIDTLISQAPFVYRVGTHVVAYRFFLCPVTADDAIPRGCAELRWVPAAQLADYVFDPPAQVIVARLQAVDHDR